MTEKANKNITLDKQNTINVTIVRGDEDRVFEQDYLFSMEGRSAKNRPTVLDVLLQAEQNEMPDLAYRYGCRNGLCGVCTVEVNGVSRLACRTKVKEGFTIKAVSSLPIIRDLVVKRQPVNEQIRGKIPVDPPARNGQNNTGDQKKDKDAFIKLGKCIECYACINNCPLHKKNDHSEKQYDKGNPYSFLKLQRAYIDPNTSKANRKKVLSVALDLGLQTCVDCSGCGCGVGINLRQEVIKPLLQNTGLIDPDDKWPKPK